MTRLQILYRPDVVSVILRIFWLTGWLYRVFFYTGPPLKS